VRNEVYEKALPLFELAARVQPSEPKWGLMAASCLRRIGAYPQALARYGQKPAQRTGRQGVIGV
jgi:intraflagellar transport protein 88